MKIHPELVPAVEALPAIDWMADVKWSREAMAGVVLQPSDDDRIVIDERTIAGGDGQDMAVRIYRPVVEGPTPAVIWSHGGGFALGGLDSEDANCRVVAAEQRVTVVAPDYRLAPENPYPAGFNDCYAALTWVSTHAAELGVDEHRLGVAGHSAGAALAAGVALAARDRKGPTLVAMYLGYPVLHDDPQSQSLANATDARLWNAPQVRAMWDLYLGGREASAYAAPGRIDDLTGLPYTYVTVHGADPHRDEALDFIKRLAEANVVVEAHLVPGAPHMADVYAPNAEVVRRSVNAWTNALGQALRS